MANKFLRQCSLATGIGLGSYLVGVYYERHRTSNNASLECPKNWPGLPLYGTVSAATAFTPAPQPNASRVSQIMKYGFPGLDHVRSFDDFVLSYDRKTRVAHWVFEHLTRDTVRYNEAIDRGKCNFTPDESIHPYFRADNSDYKGSGFDRGHLAAAGNHRVDQRHVEQTFFLSNMAPQVGVGFNRNSWNRLEKYVRKLTRVYQNVYCCTGPLYLPRCVFSIRYFLLYTKKEADGKSYVKYEVIGANNVAVPTHFFKVLVGETATGELEMEAYVMPNQVIDDATPLSSFQVPPESIERAAGLLFFDNVARSKVSKINGKKH